MCVCETIARLAASWDDKYCNTSNVLRLRRPDRLNAPSRLRSLVYPDGDLSHPDHRVGAAVIYLKLIATGPKLTYSLPASRKTIAAADSRIAVA